MGIIIMRDEFTTLRHIRRRLRVAIKATIKQLLSNKLLYTLKQQIII